MTPTPAEASAPPQDTAPPVGAGSTQELRDRIRELEARNAALEAASATPAAYTPRPGPTRSRRGWWRALLSAVCIVLAALLVSVSVVGGWARTQLVSQSQFVATFAPMAKNPAVQNLVITEAMGAVDAKVDFDKLTAQAIAGISDLGLPPAAAHALGLLQKPAADGLRGLVQSGITKVVQSDAFAGVWSDVVAGAHRALTTVATSDGSGVVVMTPRGLGVKLGPIIAQVKQQLVSQGVGIAGLIPAVDKTVIVGDGNVVMTVRTVYALAVTAGTWLPFVTLGLLVLGVILARRRAVAVLGAGVALFLGGGTLAIALSVGHTVVGMTAGQLSVSATALDYIYGQLVDGMTRTAAVVAVLGVVIAVLGWVTGSWRSSRSVRSGFGGVNRGVRRSLRGHGLDTGAFGRGLHRFRTAVYIVAAVIGVAWLLALRPLTFGDIVLVLAVMLAAIWVLELLQCRDDEGPDGAVPARGTASVPAVRAASDARIASAPEADGADSDALPTPPR